METQRNRRCGSSFVKKNRELRLAALKSPNAVVLFLVLLLGLIVVGNTFVKRGSVLDEGVITDQTNRFNQMDRYVEAKVIQGFEGREFIALLYHFPDGIATKEDLWKIVGLNQATREYFTDEKGNGPALASLAETPSYLDNGERLEDDPLITERMLRANDFDIKAWKARVMRDETAYGILVGRDFTWASVARYLPPGYDEITEFRRTVEFVEQRHIPWYEWFWKRDIHPVDPQLGVAGWVAGRGALDQSQNVDLMKFVTIGVLATFPIFWAALGSWKNALISVIVMITIPFLGTRGLMGWIGIPERIFTLLAYASVIVQGTSFALHKFSTHREASPKRRFHGWVRAFSVDGLILKTAGIAAFGFGTLWVFGLAPIREMGMSAVLGIGLLVILSRYVLPAIHMKWGDDIKPMDARKNLLERLIDYPVGLSLRAVTWLMAGWHPWIAAVLFIGIFAIPATLFVNGSIKSGTQALDFIKDTLVERQARFLNQPNNPGFEFLDLYVEPGGGGTIKDARFLAAAWAYQQRLQGLVGARETVSIVSTIHQISGQSFGKEMPETNAEVVGAFFLIEASLAPAMQRQQYHEVGVRIAVSYGMDDSVLLGKFCQDALTIAEDFPELKVSAFNKVPLYPEVDKAVRQGKVSNVFASQAGIALICALLLWLQSRKHRVRFSSIGGGLVMGVPLLFGTAVMGLVMWGLKIPLDMSTASIGALTINAATDFSLYMALTYHAALGRLDPETALKETFGTEGRVVIADCLLNVICFLPLLASHFPIIQQLGWMMGVMLAACAMGAMLGMMTLLTLFTERRPAYVQNPVPDAPAVAVGS